MNQSKRHLELALSFWIGIGLMSIISVLRITLNFNTLGYYWIMFGFSIIFVIICILLIKRKKEK
jgi:hypothetical protein